MYRYGPQQPILSQPDQPQPRTLRLTSEQWSSLVDPAVASSILDEKGHVLHPRLAAVLERAGFVVTEPVECEVVNGSGDLVFRQTTAG